MNNEKDPHEDYAIDEHESEIRSTDKRSINWRRIELVKEKLWLKKQLQEYDDDYFDSLGEDSEFK